MKKRVWCVAIISIIIIALPRAAQAGWTRTYGGAGWDVGNDVLEVSDGGYIVVGATSISTEEDSDLWILRTDANGDSLFTKTYGVIGSDGASRIKATDDGGYLVFGWTDSLGGGGSLVLKVTEDGDTLWSLILSKKGYVEQTSDGGYIVTGQENEDVFLARYDEEGNVKWARTYPENRDDEGRCVLQTADGGYVVAGVTGVFQKFYLGLAWCFRTDSVGGILWEYLDSVPGVADRSWAKHLIEVEDGYIFTGGYECDDMLSLSSLTAVKLSSSGKLDWRKTLVRGDGSDGNFIQETSDGGYIIAGNNARWDLLLLKIDIQGDSLWASTFGSTKDDCGLSVRQTSEGGYIAVGFISWDPHSPDCNLYLVKTEADGDTLGTAEEPIESIEPKMEAFSSIGDQIIIRYSGLPEGFHAEVFDASGRKVDELKFPNHEGVLIWGEKQSPGVYFIVPMDGEARVYKVILVR